MKCGDKHICVPHAQEYNLSVMYYLSHFLVDVANEKKGKVLKLDAIENGDAWKEMDLLIFNTWHWWIHRGRNLSLIHI